MRGAKLFIGEKLRVLREENKLTQARFAQKLGISTSYLNQLENNQRHDTATVLLAWLNTLPWISPACRARMATGYWPA